MRSAWNWIKRHWGWILMVFVVIPLLGLGLMAQWRNFLIKLPVVGPLVAGLPQVGSSTPAGS